MTTSVRRWPIAGFYACYFAVVGVWIPYWPLYLAHLGHGAQTIGLLTALTQWIRIPAPPFWGHMADRGGRHPVILGTSLGALAAFSLFFMDSSLLWIFGVTVLYSLFHTGPLALVDATAMEQSIARHWDYGRLRLWGSWGFIVCSLGGGPLSDQFGLGAIPMLIALLLALTALCTTWLPRTSIRHDAGIRFWTLFERTDVRWFYFSATMMQFSHGGYYGFMSLHLQHQGFSRTAIGLLWAIGVLAEVMLMRHSRAWIERVGVARLLTLSLLLATLRWSVYATTVELVWLVGAQLLHAFTFGAFHVASVRRVHDFAPESARGVAQGWLAALSYGVGGGMGMALSGVLLEQAGHTAMFGMLALAAGVGTLASRRSERLLAGHAASIPTLTGSESPDPRDPPWNP
ncbi:putative 3-phenylpropionic acid transporter [Candidatus Magnetaquicoccaceae bacterium FCR-1]|uniref:3-phenylpropionic acid transporter n=1 Tax=Candidatus Magnetaquiglobus chichijimensis TaxID=3141448 RepID=A0ABQ0C787_9PROT